MVDTLEALEAREAAAERLRRTVSPRPRSTRLESLAEAMIPQSPLDYALMALGGPGGKAAKTAAVALGGALESSEAEGAFLNRLLKGIKAYHGSPHEFDKFDISKVGTGEGSQVYGHGLYFAENPKVAETYRKLAERRSVGHADYHKYNMPADLEQTLYWLDKPLPRERATDLVRRRASQLNFWADQSLESTNEASRKLGEKYRKIAGDIQALDVDKLRMPKGHTYEVNIRADPQDLLNLDVPLSRQPKAVRERYWEGLGDPSGMSLMPRTTRQAQEFREAGVPGLRFWDRGSRQRGEGTSNYVIFDDSIIDILKRYGISGFAAIPLLREIAAERARRDGKSVE